MGGELLEAFAELESAASRCRKLLGEDAWRLCEAELAGLTRRQHDLDAQIQTIGLVLVAEADTRGVATAAGATSTQAWLTQALRMTPQLAKHRVTLARGLKERYPDTGAALAESHISMEQAAAIVSVVDGLPSKATPEDKEGAERFLLERAGHLHAGDLRRLGKRIDAVIDPDGTIDREEAAKERRGLTFRDHHDGTQTIAWRETEENIALVKAAMSALSAPVPAGDGTLDPAPRRCAGPTRCSRSWPRRCARAGCPGPAGNDRTSSSPATSPPYAARGSPSPAPARPSPPTRSGASPAMPTSSAS